MDFPQSLYSGNYVNAFPEQTPGVSGNLEVSDASFVQKYICELSLEINRQILETPGVFFHFLVAT